jgi:hypothetical protein
VWGGLSNGTIVYQFQRLKSVPPTTYQVYHPGETNASPRAPRPYSTPGGGKGCSPWKSGPRFAACTSSRSCRSAPSPSAWACIVTPSPAPSPASCRRVTNGRRVPSPLEPFKPRIQALLDLYLTLSGVRVRELSEAEGYQGSQTIVNDCLQDLRGSRRTPPRLSADHVCTRRRGPGRLGGDAGSGPVRGRAAAGVRVPDDAVLLAPAVRGIHAVLLRISTPLWSGERCRCPSARLPQKVRKSTACRNTSRAA